MTALRLSRVHYPVTTLGPGRRLGIWLQGCTLGCRGCLSRDTWDAAGGREVGVDDLLDELQRLAPAPDGVTVSGGEPFEQPVALALLLRGIAEQFPDADLLCYSGMPRRRLERDFTNVLGLLDALVAEPFVERRPVGGAWRGSDNQPLLLLTDRARDRYAGAEKVPPALQLAEADGGLYVIGIPQRGDLALLEQRLGERGIALQGASWR